MFDKAYIVTVDMGYGHQRAVYPLKDIAACPKGWQDASIITANNYGGIPKKDRAIWEGNRKAYETISRMKKIPLFGQGLFRLMDYMQRIEPFYPKRDLSRPSFQLKQLYRLIRKKKWGKHLIDVLNEKPLPLVTSFFGTAFMAEEHGYKGDIYCLCTDTDVSRAWAPLNAKKSRIKYFAPNRRVKERLKLYGVREENIYITGFPLPKENIGGKGAKILKGHLGCRISNLDPNGKYQKKYAATIETYLGARYCSAKAKHPLTITFAVGGAGAQRELGVIILNSLHDHIDKGRVRLNLVAGSRNDVYRFYEKHVKELHLEKKHGGTISIIFAKHKMDYFAKFDEVLQTTDILWTKPSELSFYAGLGIPIIMAPTIGSQEQYNKAWLHSISAGFEQEDPRYTNEWLFDWLESGWLAEAAMEGFLDAPRHGAYHIEDIVLKGKRHEIEDMHLM
ncbi:MAG: hypothetical protein COV60_02730 [Candidatus Magasanikbacteria bacterium CG11_big_fil_rev_8_21_14_0_20_43_7]|uniref:DUF6938 domain-containing protein n=1 Tax=Candidatus Magasanikbacteria bacterium CG11_big_fil_rev_8_21_14_0_20_43_7 TaxID=1974654 RepID=A0A2H0N288_9BACT|nr:MAG: hypothetical protein COV60_02730 [Candidatus Magasanikbacteria bacterium CG11_big_fil_rev_8_21_14_0_20_43_7]